MSVALLFIDRDGSAPGPIGRTVGRLVWPLHVGVTRAGRSVRALRQDYLALTDVRTQNAELAAEVQRLRADQAEVEGLRAENERLRGLLELADRRKDLRLRAARVTARAVSPYFRVLKVTLDVGEDAVRPGMPVVAPGGLVGQLRTVADRECEVLLVTDPRSAIDVVLETSRARGLAVGTGEPDRYAARLEYLQRSDESAVGERVLTTGDDGRYPRGLPVGRVTTLKAQAHGLFQEAELEPLVDLSALEEVFVVLGPSGLTADGTELERSEPPVPPSARPPGAPPTRSPP
jgi:rod shape-determining protein MreC